MASEKHVGSFQQCQKLCKSRVGQIDDKRGLWHGRYLNQVPGTSDKCPKHLDSRLGFLKSITLLIDSCSIIDPAVSLPYKKLGYEWVNLYT